jgi:hypothetical protein
MELRCSGRRASSSPLIVVLNPETSHGCLRVPAPALGLSECTRGAIASPLVTAWTCTLSRAVRRTSLAMERCESGGQSHGVAPWMAARGVRGRGRMPKGYASSLPSSVCRIA